MINAGKLSIIKVYIERIVVNIMISLITELSNIIRINTLNTRELAMLIWLLILLVWMVLNKKIRKSLYDVVKAFCNIKLITPIILFLIYTICVVVVLFKVNLWGTFLLKDTIVWFISSGVLTVFKSIDGSKKRRIL